MKYINLSDRTNINWSGKFVDESYYDVLINEDVTIYKPNGDMLAVFLKNKIDNVSINNILPFLAGLKLKTNNRGVAAGTGYTNKILKNGLKSKTNRTTKMGEVDSGVIGFVERSPRFPYCRPTAFNLKFPDKFKKIMPFLNQINGLFMIYGGERAVNQYILTKKTSPDFIIPGTNFTTVTINRNFRTACHMDAGDLPQGLSCMAVLSSGKYTGGVLVLPDFKIGINLTHGDLIIFDPHEYHGNTMIVPLTKNAARYSFVCYYREKIQFCLSNEEELIRAQNRKVGEKLC